MKLLSFILILSTVFLVKSATCNAVAFGGGGSYGAHSAGAMQAFVDLLPPASINYQVVTGISAGALNALGFCQYPPGQEANSTAYMLQIWKSLNSSQQIFEEWTGGLIAGLLFHSGLYSSAPENKLLKNSAKTTSQRKLVIGSVEINSGAYKKFNETLTLAQQIESGMCSSAVQVIFNNQDFEGGVYCDGGTFTNIDAVSAIERCLEVTQDQTQITLDIFSCFANDLVNEPAKMKTPEVFQRAYQIRGYTGGFRNILAAKTSYPKVNFRYFIEPLEGFKYNPLNFSSAFVNELINFGYQNAQKIIAGGSNLGKAIQAYKERIIYP